MADAACQYQNQIQVQPVTNSGTNGTCISSPHIVQYPKVPRRDDGKWMALGSIIGGLIGKFANGDKLDQASDAESTWEDLNNRLKEKGLEEWALVPVERALASDSDTRLLNRTMLNWQYEADEKAYADKLKACDDALHERLCALAQCGYTPDYDGILMRARADAESLVAAKTAAIKRDATRYNTGMNRAVCIDIVDAGIIAAVAAASDSREKERQAAWKFNWDVTLQGVQQIEGDRLKRAALARDYDNTGINIEQNRYNNHNNNAYNSLKLGADMLASAGQNFAWLAESLRRSAEKDTGNFASLGALIIPLLLTTFGGCSFTSKDCDCPAEDGAAAAAGSVPSQ